MREREYEKYTKQDPSTPKVNYPKLSLVFPRSNQNPVPKTLTIKSEIPERDITQNNKTRKTQNPIFPSPPLISHQPNKTQFPKTHKNIIFTETVFPYRVHAMKIMNKVA